MTSPIIDFIEARLREDEKAANAAAGLCGCHPPAPVWTFDTTEDTGDERIVIEGDAHAHQVKRKLARRWRGSYEDLFHAEHITRHDPARVLREVTAKRAIIAEHSCEWVERPDRVIGEADDPFCGACLGDAHPCLTLKHLAAAYSDHHDYREEWAA